jgi:hypothetical protein
LFKNGALVGAYVAFFRGEKAVFREVQGGMDLEPSKTRLTNQDFSMGSN